ADHVRVRVVALPLGVPRLVDLHLAPYGDRTGHGTDDSSVRRIGHLDDCRALVPASHGICAPVVEVDEAPEVARGPGAENEVGQADEALEVDALTREHSADGAPARARGRTGQRGQSRCCQRIVVDVPRVHAAGLDVLRQRLSESRAACSTQSGRKNEKCSEDAHSGELRARIVTLRVQSNRTETTFEQPGSSMVTPYIASAVSIVRLLWVIAMNCVSSVISRSSRVKRSMFASSSGASTSSRMQNGDGRKRKIAIRSEIAVSAFSPPERSRIDWFRFPGGCAMISTPDSRGSFSSSSRISAVPPRKRRVNISVKLALIAANASANRSAEVALIFRMESCSSATDLTRSSLCVVRNVSLSDSVRCSSQPSTLTGPRRSSDAASSAASASSFDNASSERAAGGSRSPGATPTSSRVCAKRCWRSAARRVAATSASNRRSRAA